MAGKKKTKGIRVTGTLYPSSRKAPTKVVVRRRSSKRASAPAVARRPKEVKVKAEARTSTRPWWHPLLFALLFLGGLWLLIVIVASIPQVWHTITTRSVTAAQAPVQAAPQGVAQAPAPMQDLGTLLGPQPMIVLQGEAIDWDHMAKMPEWREDKGLTGVQVLYVQSGVPNQINLPMLNDEKVFVVPQGTVLIFGTYSGELVLTDKTFAYSNGFYGALTEGTVVSNLRVSDGFILLAKAPDAQSEYCARIAQTVNEKWANDHLFRPKGWPLFSCVGVITTVIDNDR